jgi:flagellar biogenesis protein FliO
VKGGRGRCAQILTQKKTPKTKNCSQIQITKSQPLTPKPSLVISSVRRMNNILVNACKELIDDAKTSCADLVFKEICLEILARAKNILTNTEFETLKEYAIERIEEKTQTALSAQIETQTIP